mgnify:CR=1 FL=1|tara:strand:+ start:1076 stop:1393 length:318 start_codon:yes stop_codon:yes gene_type:complete
MDDLREVIALALLNDDRKAGGWPEVKSRETIPNSEGYPRNADAALAAIKQAGFVVVPESEAQMLVEATLFLEEVDGQYRTRMPDNFLWRLDQFNARRAMIEAYND